MVAYLQAQSLHRWWRSWLNSEESEAERGHDGGKGSPARVVCPTPSCRSIVWVCTLRNAQTLPCRTCGCTYPAEAFPEASRVLPAEIERIWKSVQSLALDSSLQEEGTEALQLIEAANVAIETVGTSGCLRDAGSPLAAYSGLRYQKPGTWWLLNAAVRAGDCRTMAMLCCVPQHVEALTADSPGAAAMFLDWFTGSWADAVINSGLVDLILDMDDCRHGHGHSADSGPLACGPLFPHVYKAVIRVYNKVCIACL